ncbi:Uncharacterised protein [Vibrio cholerae]|nr:Uncharacterised protein [Vibrio cholerae]
MKWKAVSPLKAHCLTLRVCCVWFREKYGAVQYSVTSSL